MDFQKNVAQSFYEETAIEAGFFILKFNNETDENQTFKREVSANFIQFHFCIKGSALFVFNDGNYKLPIQEDHSLLLYNPQRDLPINLDLEKHSWMISVLLPINKFHGLFSTEANYITFLDEENKDRKYYKDGNISPSMAIVLNQLMNYNLHPTIKPLYFKAKAYELLSLYFNRPADADVEQCPFLADEDNVSKIKKAKQIIISRMAEPPTLQQLADEINLPINRLKEGFKQIYGDSVFSFLFDYKMEVARQLLASGSHNVNEVGLKVGYSTSSHFIAAFKKRFGTTPKKFLMGLNV
ncbi:DNA-binding domain-containing protein, AraC-type [Aequorivita sublithincola DSM 14238]|uniref:DNA-binding domain-containing protein, AraC-type n=1 Tax=Aequorivita sublithincola (strain DSM 14238 / LMG 21431 / ACAM 643 / 9-3) TaxID=746697 RepID=I3YUY2_AEQSU|nr:AraC family transcriptional regulator [Aequorivita sublithincola]AFL80800.1 DNA-binding domain-containing protein, AraC-type [Aequorivita sublithincola DSM 14238]